jgi:hypothetical protein
MFFQTITTHYTDGDDYFSYKRMCGTLGSDCAAVKSAATVITGRLEYTGYSTTTTCCDGSDLCNTNGATVRQVGALCVVAVIVAYWFL